MAVDNILEKLEALLFASGRAMPLEQLSELIGEPNKRSIKNALEKLAEAYTKRESPLMIIEQDGAWKLTVREVYLPLVRKIVADTELPKSVLETLAVIAWKSPVMQSTVIKVRTNKAYEHIDVLENYGFIMKKKAGRSFKLSLAEKFFQYFDVKDGDIKEMFKDTKGIEKELEEEQKKHIDSQTQQRLNEVAEATEAPQKQDEEEPIEVKVDPEIKNLGGLEVVDAVEGPEHADLEVVDTIKDSQDGKDIDEFMEDVEDEARKEAEAVEEVDEVFEEATEDEDDETTEDDDSGDSDDAEEPDDDKKDEK